MITLAKILFGITLGLCIADIADALPVQFVYVNGPHIMPVEVVPELIKEVKAKYRAIGVRLQDTFIKRNLKGGLDYETRADSLSVLSDNYSGLVRVADRTFFLVPPYPDNGGAYWLVGFGRLGLGVASIELANQDGVDRYHHSVNAVTHELGHVLGARHDNNTCTLMDTGLLGCENQEGLVFSQKSKREIRAYVFGKERRG